MAKNSNKMMIQTTLYREDNNHEHVMTTWLREDKRVKVGSVITLVGDPNKWIVRSQGIIRIPEPVLMVKRVWNVGGLK